jgi:hypothetical protein
LGIDRFEDGDAPRRAPNGDAAPGLRHEVVVLADPERRVAEFRGYQARVNGVYGAANETQASELTERDAVRAEHVEVLERIEATDKPRDIGSVLPKSFNLLTASEGKVWVAPNATRHIWEETRGLTFGRSISQEQRLAGLADAVDNATIGNWEQMQFSRGWELIFSRSRHAGGNPVLKHARYTGGGGS